MKSDNSAVPSKMVSSERDLGVTRAHFGRGFATSRVWLGVAIAVAMSSPLLAQPPIFQHVVIDATNPSDPHCKALGDIDGDGFLDALAASSSGGGMFWYEYPDWTEHAIRATGSWTTDMQVADIDNDGDLDVVIPDSSGLEWYENPLPGGNPRTSTWTVHLIGTDGANNHDVEVGDVDGDGALDVVTRKKAGGWTYLWRQESPTSWSQVTVSSTDGEGTALADLDEDDDLDVVHNGFWVEQVDLTTWVEHTIDSNWSEDVGVLVVDINDDGDLDVVLAPSESSGRFSWYETTDPVNGPWIEHSIDPAVSYFHTFKAADMDRDGDLDLVTAEMHQSSNPDEVSIYLNEGSGLVWNQQVVDTTGSHNLRVGDIGNDLDIDIYGANWNDSAPNSAVIEMWENQSGPLSLDGWQRHIIETSLPWQAVFVAGGDVNGDGLPDLVTGGWWYPNPGDLDGAWSRTTIGAPLYNMAAVHDFDGDGDLDVLGTNGKVAGESFSWGQNNGAGLFTIRGITTPTIGGDFLQGVSVDQVIAGGEEEVVLSWHNGASGSSMFTVPSDPTVANWPVASISATTNQEQVPTGDVDGDGDTDIHLGSDWLRQEANGTFSTQSGVAVSAGVPDRVVLADIDGDGDLDVVIGVEFGQRLVWGESSDDAQTWTERVIATDVDYFSVDAADIDRDGDIDVVGGAHQGNGEVYVYENNGQGASWITHTVDPGDSTLIDHHDGTQLVDMDLDGDLDILSIGWTKRSLTIYENLAIGGGDVDLTPPVIESVIALSSPTQVVVDFSEALDPTTAEDIANYAISGGVSVTDAHLDTDETTVTLTTSTLSEGTVYQLTVNDVEDTAGNAIALDSQTPFVFVQDSQGLAAYWPLNEGTGTITLDASGHGHSGTLVNGPQWIGGPSLDFDGVNDYVDVGTLDATGGALTLAAWIYSEDLSNCVASDCRILSKTTGTAEDDHYFMLSTIENGANTRLRFRLKTDGVTSTLIASSGDLPEGTWVHAAAVYDGASMSLYLNGSLVGSTGKTGSLTPNSAVAVWIGGNPPDGAARPWDGLLDEVRIYARALSAAEIQALPPPSTHAIFSGGFESGDTSAWSATIP
ncbi:MAG: FG-GAP-like repeat-containing protein [Thermoanaerobaculia bacterium]